MQRRPRGTRPPTGTPGATLLATLLLAALLALTLALAPRAEASSGLSTTWRPKLPNTISRANLDGTEKELSFIKTPRACGVAVDDEHVYWGTGEGVGRANLDSTGVNGSFITAAGVRTCATVAVDDAHVYWTDWEGGPIGRANLDGTGVDNSFITGVNACAPALDPAHIYWVTPPTAVTSLGPVTDPGSMGRANLDGTGVKPNFIAGSFEPPLYFDCALAVDPAQVYWRQGEGSIGRANVDGTDVNANFITGAFVGRGMAVDASHIYWPDSYGPIGRANLDGTDLERYFITGGNEPGGVTVDARHIYWANRLNPSEFLISSMARDKKRGTATLISTVPGPGLVKLRGRWVVRKTLGATRFGTLAPFGEVEVPVKAKGKKKKQLKRSGQAKVKAKVTYTPDGGEPNTQTKRLSLVKRS